MNSEGLSDRFLDYAASIIIIAKIRDRIICDKSGVLNVYIKLMTTKSVVQGSLKRQKHSIW